MKLPVVLAFALLSAACIRETHLVNAPTPRPAQAPRQPTVWDRQIQNALDAGDGDVALRTLRARVAADPASIPARLELAQAYTKRGYHEVALEICRLAAERFPESGEVRLALTSALRETNRRNDAIQELEIFLKAHPQDSPAYYSWLGILRDEAGLSGPAESAHRKALGLAPKSDYLHNNLGYNLLLQSKPSDAADEFRAALALNPHDDVARNNLAVALVRAGSSGEAVSLWQSAADPATAHSNLAAVLIENGNYSDARKELQIALGYNRQHTAALKNLELVSQLDGNPATMEAKPGEPSRWTRMRTGFRRLFVGPLSDSRTEPAKPATTRLTGEEQ